MGGGRSPCCDKSKVKTGPWSAAEDARLVAFIREHGHSNWRALPKQAGLLRCGKSCRLRWINYLRPDVKRGNFTPEEEETIIQLHNSLGNKWSKIASHLPGRTDNEIKNVWNTHLKKRAMASKNQRNSSSSSTSSESRSSEVCESSELIKAGTGVETTMIPEFTKVESPSPLSDEVHVPCSSSSSNHQSEVSVTCFENQKVGIDDDLWMMLDSMDTLSSSMDFGKDDELKKWMEFFECELSLEGNGDQWLMNEEHQNWECSPLWSSSPVFLDF